MKLSTQQVRFLRSCLDSDSRTPFAGNRNAGRLASAWYRTAQSLADRGLVDLERVGDAQVASITDPGRAVLVERGVWQAGK